MNFSQLAVRANTIFVSIISTFTFTQRILSFSSRGITINSRTNVRSIRFAVQEHIRTHIHIVRCWNIHLKLDLSYSKCSPRNRPTTSSQFLYSFVGNYQYIIKNRRGNLHGKQRKSIMVSIIHSLHTKSIESSSFQIIYFPIKIRSHRIYLESIGCRIQIKQSIEGSHRRNRSNN